MRITLSISAWNFSTFSITRSSEIRRGTSTTRTLELLPVPAIRGLGRSARSSIGSQPGTELVFDLTCGETAGQIIAMNSEAYRISLRFGSGIFWALFLSLGYAQLVAAQSAAQYRQRGIELSQARSWDQAIANYQKSLELAPDDPLTHYNLALTLEHKGDQKQAVQEFEAALRLKPNWAEAHYGLGASFYDLHDQDGALKELRAAVELEPANAGAHRMLARIYLEQNNPSAAEGELRKAIQSRPSAELYLELGLAQGQL